MDNTNSSDSHIILKIDQDGNIEWNQTYATSGSTSVINSVIETSDGGLVFAGWIQTPPGSLAYIWAVKADSSGNIQWTQTYGNTEVQIGGMSSKYYMGGSRVIESSDGSLVVAGQADLGSWSQVVYYLVKTQPFLPLPTPTPIPTPSPTPTLIPTPSSARLQGHHRILYRNKYRGIYRIFYSVKPHGETHNREHRILVTADDRHNLSCNSIRHFDNYPIRKTWQTKNVIISGGITLRAETFNSV